MYIHGGGGDGSGDGGGGGGGEGGGGEGGADGGDGGRAGGGDGGGHKFATGTHPPGSTYTPALSQWRPVLLAVPDEPEAHVAQSRISSESVARSVISARTYPPAEPKTTAPLAASTSGVSRVLLLVGNAVFQSFVQPEPDSTSR